MFARACAVILWGKNGICSLFTLLLDNYYDLTIGPTVPKMINSSGKGMKFCGRKPATCHSIGQWKPILYQPALMYSSCCFLEFFPNANKGDN